MDTTTVLRRGFAIAAAMLVSLFLVAAPAHAAEEVKSFVANAVLSADGTLQVKSTITFDGAAPASFQQVLSTSSRTADQLEYRFTISDIAVTSNGQPLAAEIRNSDAGVTVTVPSAGVSAPIEIGYKVVGAATATPGDTTTLTWALLQGLSLPVASFDGTLGVPALFRSVDCGAGDPAALGTCLYYGGGTHDSPNPFFHDEGRAAGESVVAIVRFPASAVATNEQVRELWTVQRAFSVAPLPLGVALGLAALGGLALWSLHRRLGRDAIARGAAAPTPVAEFAAVGEGRNAFRVLDGVRPGEVGTLVDERVDPIDVTATLLDLAVRGHLVITQLPAGSAYGAADWTFARKAGNGQLLDYERTLLDAVAPVQGEPVQVSNLVGSVGAVIGQVQSELYDEVVARGWFTQRPDSTRNRWAAIGWTLLAAALVGAVLLVLFTHFGLTGLVAIGLALGVLLLAQEMPSRTVQGSSILGGLDALRAALLVQPTNSVVAGDAYSGLSSVLPYAVVLGGKERWLQALVDADSDSTADEDELGWFRGPEGWHLRDLPASLANFVTTVQGTLFGR